jgi:glycosyltransferase involved in cell wall biosynthesis
VERSVHELSLELLRAGHHVEVVCSDEPAEPKSVDGIAVRRLPTRFKLATSNVPRGATAAMAASRPDLIHVHFPTAPWPELAVAAGRRLGCPVVLTYNNDLVGARWKGRLADLWGWAVLPRVIRGCAAVVTPNADYPTLSRHLPSLGAKHHHIEWGVDVDRFRPRSRQGNGTLQLAFLGILDGVHRYKGLEVLLEALAGIPGSTRCRLAVAGAGEERAHYEALASRLGLGARVQFLGFVPESALADFYAQCDLFVLPSTTVAQEGFGLVALEALASGRALLTTPVAAVSKAVREAGAGVVVPAGDRAALAAAIVELAAAREELVRMGERGRTLVEQSYTWSRVAQRYLDLYGLVSNG